MERKSVNLLVTIKLDPVPGSFHTPESVRENVQSMLFQMIPHYQPSVVILPETE